MAQGLKKVSEWQTISIKSSSSFETTCPLVPSLYKFVAWTKDGQAGIGPRVVDLKLTISPDEQVFNIQLSKKGEKKIVELDIKKKSTLVIQAQTKAFIKALTFEAELHQVVDKEDADRLDGQWDVDLSTLSEQQQFRLHRACANWPPLDSPPPPPSSSSSSSSPSSSSGVTEVTALNYDNSQAVAELKRESVYKTRAYQRGLIRPFLLLVSMHPRRRLSVALSLDIQLLDDLPDAPEAANVAAGSGKGSGLLSRLKSDAKSDENFYYGNAHAEAWLLLSKDRLGIVARTNEAFSETLNPLADHTNWYQTVYRVTKKVFVSNTFLFLKNTLIDEELKKQVKTCYKTAKDSAEMCKFPNQPDMWLLEETFLRCFFQMIDLHQKPSEEQLSRLKEFADKNRDTIEMIRKKLRAADWQDEELCTQLATNALYSIRSVEMKSMFESVSEKKKEKVSVLVGLPVVMFFLSPMPLIPLAMFTKNILATVFGSTHGTLFPTVLSLMMHRLWLSLGGVNISDFYPMSGL